MRNLYLKLVVFLLLSIDVTASNLNSKLPARNTNVTELTDAPNATITRGPYLQMGNQTSITIRWRTDVNTDTKVTCGTAFGTYPIVVTNATSLTEHEISITGLSADTKYYYTAGSTGAILEGTVNDFFQTLPLSGTTRKIRVLAFGDCGNNSTNQTNVRDAFISYANARNINPDAWLLAGDNAYNGGLDAEFTSSFFNIYNGTLLKNIKLYPCPGNHDYNNLASNQPLRNLPYYNQFTLPTLGEIGGVASNTEAFYSFNIEDIHFVSLDSYGTENGASVTRLYDTAIGNRQADWLRSDLAANTKKWTIVYFHHPPYTMGSHNSDAEAELISMHDNIPAILERYGVDLVINGHSHAYERSFMIKNLYGPSTGYLPATNLVNGSSAKYNGLANTCPYSYQSGQVKHGTTYVVTGSSGQLGGTSAGWPLPFMSYTDASNGGSFYFEIDSNRLDAKFISYTTGPLTPFLRDSFTIFKDVNNIQNITVNKNAALTLTASWRGKYFWTHNSATVQAVAISTAVPGSYTYTVKDANAGSCIQDVFNVTVSNPVPILLVSFTAALDKDRVLLDWTTAQEQNNKFFTIERSTDGINYYVLAKVNGAGTSNNPINYHLEDEYPYEGINYYRLSQTNYDGTTKLFNINRITYKSSRFLITSILNTGSGQARLVIRNTVGGMITMRVIDVSGYDVLQESFSVNNGGNKDLSLNPGVYIVLMINKNGDRISSKIMVL